MITPASMAQMNGSGNKIVVVDMRGRHDRITSEAVCSLALTNEMTFDQMMAIYDSEDKNTDYYIEIRNKNGSLAEACGNGMRCVAEWLYIREQRTSFIFDTAGGMICTQRLPNGMISVDMGNPRWNWQDIPLAVEIKDTNHVALQCGLLVDASLVSMGNPHAIFIVENSVADYNLEDYGPQLECDPMFPKGANISIVRVTSRDSVDLRTWERGVGLTDACGTAACASVVATCRRLLTKRQVLVTLPGGKLYISWKKNNHVIMTGPTQYECSGLFNLITGNHIPHRLAKG
ncbi:MAG: diaminopimelate epimerase [Candidatus Tokpelaia sp. JSC085]|nr:MAG: diaminopimelate epimerase [Candidatus Tokpelaia sp. JSC085]